MEHSKRQIDTLIINGRIYTLREEGETAEALGIDNGKIVFAGSNSGAEEFSASETIDLEGNTVIPGMGDSHLHLYAYCQNQTSVKLDDAGNLDELIQIMKRKAEVCEKGKWIKGAGFDHTKFPENRLPTRWDLDRISTEHPIVIRRCCLHVMAANSLAIETAKITRDMIQDAGGLIEVDESGEMTGIFRENAISIFDDIVPDPLSDKTERKRIMLEVFDDMVSKGITIIHTYAAKIWNYEESLAVYRDLEREGSLPVRVVVSMDEFFEKEDAEKGDKSPYDKVKYGSYKIFTDGSFGSRSAALLTPYSDDENNCGILMSKDRLIEDLHRALGKGLQPAIHVIGDRAMEMTLDAIETVIDQAGRIQLPIRIIHAQLVHEDQLERLKRLPVILDVQPVFLCTDLHWIESRLGRKRVQDAYIWKTLMEAGLVLAGGSDCPVEAYDPMKGIYAAVTRQDLNGYPEGGWLPSEKLSVFDAICLFTKNIAYATGDEDVIGTLEAGKFADFAVLGQDPFLVEPQGIKDIKVLKTFVAGKLVYSRQS